MEKGWLPSLAIEVQLKGSAVSICAWRSCLRCSSTGTGYLARYLPGSMVQVTIEQGWVPAPYPIENGCTYGTSRPESDKVCFIQTNSRLNHLHGRM